MQMTTFNENEMMAALCLWEAALSAHTNGRDREGAFSAYWDAHGAFGMRQAVLDMTEHCELVWDVLTDHGERDDIAYDWEYCPAFLMSCVDWDDATPRPLDECVEILSPLLT